MDARIWGPDDRTGGQLDTVLDALRGEFPDLLVERLVCTHPDDDDNVYWLTVGPPAKLYDWRTVQVDTRDGGEPPYFLEGEREDGARANR